MGSLKQKLTLWDGKETASMIELYQTNENIEALISDLILMLDSDIELQKAITWLLKYHIDQGGTISELQQSKLLCSIEKLNHWEAKLHILQIFSYLNLKNGDYNILLEFVLSSFKSTKPFLRASAYHGLYELSKIYPGLQLSLKEQCEKALKTETSSVLVKVRKILLKLEGD